MFGTGRIGTFGGWILASVALLAARGATAGELAPFTIEAVVPGPREEVYRAFSTSAGLKAALGVNSSIELRLGGPFEWYFAPDAPEGSRGGEGCTVLAFEPGRLLSFTWNAPPKFPAERAERTFVIIEFSDAPDGGTNVRLTHGGWPAEATGKWAEVRGYFEKAWPSVLEHVRTAFASNDGHLPAAEPPPPAAAWQHFAYFIHPAREGFFTAPTEDENRIVGQHAAYIRDLLAAGRLVLAGPCHGDLIKPTATPQCIAFDLPAPGVVIFRAHDAADAKRVMEADPAVQAGIFKAVAVQYHAAFGAR